MPRNATAEVGQRRKYTFRGADYPSVTTILKLGRPKEWLGAWAAKTVAEEAEAGVERWGPAAIQEWINADRDAHQATETHQKRHKTTCPHIPSALGYLKGTPWRKRDAAGDMGTDAHTVLEDLVRGRKVHPLAPAREELEAWLGGYRPDVIESEPQVVNTEVGYAGSLDLIAEVYGERLLIDLKTSKLYDGQGRPKNVDRDWCLQLAAYRYAEHIFEDDKAWTMPDVEGCAVLWIPSDAPEQWKFIRVPAGAKEWSAFLAAKQTHDDYRTFEKQAVGELILPQIAGEAA